MKKIYDNILKIIKENNINYEFFKERFPLIESNYGKIKYINDNIQEMIKNPVNIINNFISNDDCNILINFAKNRFIDPNVAT